MDKKKILVVDDEIEFLEMLRIRLEVSGFDVITATNGQDALEKINKEKPNAVLLDVLMPGIDGLGVLKKIRKTDKDLPVYIITAFSNEERFKVANKLGASGFIVKTVDLKKEIENITTALNLSDKFKSKK
ncbi:MAG: response regulator [Candidatus Omnitrophota bacterium]|jgi:two-component system OmpR family response regulator